MNPVNVVTVGDTENHVIDALEERRGSVRVIRRCPELLDLLAACQSGLARVAVVASSAEELTATLVDRLTAVGVSVVAAAASPAETARLRGIGVFPIAALPTPDMLVEAVLGALSARQFPSTTGFGVPAATPGTSRGELSADQADADPGRSVVPPSGSRGADGDTALGGPQFPSTLAPGASSATRVARAGLPSAGGRPGVFSRFRAAFSDSGEPARTGSRRAAKSEAAGGVPGGTSGHDGQPGPRTLAVWGPAGSPGRTTLAINLAAEYAAQGLRVLVIDADSYSASIAATLGLLDESASFAQACRVADQGVLTATELERISSEVVFSGGAFALLTGLTRADRWPELRAAAVERVLQTARKIADVVVIDCGFCLEADEELSYDTVAPRRNAATLSALSQADVIYAIGGSDTIGIPRLIRALTELPELCAGTSIEVVLNKVRRKAAGTQPQKALEQAWDRFGPGLPISHFLPWDADVLDKALLEGRLLVEIAPDSTLRKAIRSICCAPVQRNQKTAVSNATAKA
ncbi:AAA family ATPase [Arthrobacter sp. GMC3]|uniref:AAA family ATPase n=1 Tax=Arthrobacter sp. GMC3 TaxID=2058894 RepID=UPI000CE451D1|nr:AAA family ATPase [Arthrobacter sp. GMC3]